MKKLLSFLLVLVLSACGGGGGSPGTLTGSSGSTTPTVTVAFYNDAGAAVTALVAGTTYSIVAKVLDAKGAALSGQVVTFTSDASFLTLVPTAGTALTDSTGSAVIKVVSTSLTDAGAGSVTGTVTVSGTAYSGKATFSMTAGATSNSPSVTVSLFNYPVAGNSISTLNAGVTYTATARVLDAKGAPMPQQVVTFTSDASYLKLSPSQAVTDPTGNASVTFVSSALTDAGAGTVTATSQSVAGKTTFTMKAVSSSNVPSLTVAAYNPSGNTVTSVTAGVTYTVKAVALDALGKAMANQVVTFSVGTGASVSPTTATTDSTGTATSKLTVPSLNASGAVSLQAAFPYTGTGATVSITASTPINLLPGGWTLQLDLRDASNNLVNAISASQIANARATLRDGSGNPVAGKLVTFSGPGSLITLSPSAGQVLTDAAGVASVTVSPLALTTTGAGTLSANAAVGTDTFTASMPFQIASSNLTLQSMSVGSGTLATYSSAPIAVTALVNGVASVNIPVQVTFSTSCGTVSPTTANTNSSGVANSTFTADQACAGTKVTVTASASGASPVSTAVAVTAPAATNLQFVSATPQIIYLTGSVGPSQSLVKFKVLDSNGNPLPNKNVSMSLVNGVSGVSIGTVGNTAAVVLPTNATGDVTVPVFSGTIPLSVQVAATLVENTSVNTASNLLTVAVGRPTQRSASLSIGEDSIEGYEIDGTTTTATLSIADRQGNPVPDGTQVNFVTSGGVMIPPTCVITGGASRCTVNLRSQGTRTSFGDVRNGVVAVMAYVPGEEDFVDANLNNVYDAGESFTDMGNAYRDDNFSGAFDTGEFAVPRTGGTACAGGEYGLPNTCDGAWGTVDVRKMRMVRFATSNPIITLVGGAGTNQLVVSIKDRNGGKMPVGSTISAVVINASPTSTCTITQNFDKIANGYTGYLEMNANLVLSLANCASKEGVQVNVKVPVSGTITGQPIYTIP